MNNIDRKGKAHFHELEDICNLWKHPATENEKRECPLWMDALEQDAYIEGCRRITWMKNKVEQVEQVEQLETKNTR
jgi:hypothetical protein